MQSSEVLSKKSHDSPLWRITALFFVRFTTFDERKLSLEEKKIKRLATEDFPQNSVTVTVVRYFCHIPTISWVTNEKKLERKISLQEENPNV